jgi:hypothetical protein
MGVEEGGREERREERHWDTGRVGVETPLTLH